MMTMTISELIRGDGTIMMMTISEMIRHDVPSYASAAGAAVDVPSCSGNQK